MRQAAASGGIWAKILGVNELCAKMEISKVFKVSKIVDVDDSETSKPVAGTRESIAVSIS